MMVMVNCLVAKCPGTSLSVARTVKVKVPACVGVPERSPEVDRRMPDGRRLLLANAHVYGATPPVATNGTL